MDKAAIGFLGTGIMGFQMARRLCEAGHPLVASNRTAHRAAPLACFGAELAASAAEAVRGREVAICMLSNGPVCDEVLYDQGVLEALPEGALLIVMSSIPVETAQEQARRAAEYGLRYIDAPVSGGEGGATDGSLAIMAGGEAADIEAAREILAVMGRVTRVGPAGSGELAKLANQVIVANSIATVAEALLLAKQGGADPAAVREALLGGFADSTILRVHGARMIEGAFDPGGPAKYQVKDQTTATALARKLDLELPVSELVQRLFEDLVEHGGGERDHSALYLELLRRNRLGGLGGL